VTSAEGENPLNSNKNKIDSASVGPGTSELVIGDIVFAWDGVDTNGDQIVGSKKIVGSASSLFVDVIRNQDIYVSIENNCSSLKVEKSGDRIWSLLNYDLKDDGSGAYLLGKYKSGNLNLKIQCLDGSGKVFSSKLVKVSFVL
jgi:hypothetical protein